MDPAERHNLILNVVQHMLSAMPSTERLGLMEHVVDHFLEGLSPEERQSTVRELVPRLLAQLMRSGNMNVDELLWAAMGSLGALEESAGSSPGGPLAGANPNTPPASSRDAFSE
jgi:hypothetical protein